MFEKWLEISKLVAVLERAFTFEWRKVGEVTKRNNRSVRQTLIVNDTADHGREMYVIEYVCVCFAIHPIVSRFRP